MATITITEKSIISKYLDEQKIKHSLSGRDYIIEMIHICIVRGGIIRITELYSEIANSYDTTPGSVERAIRHAILMRNGFDHITNSEFIFVARDAIELSPEYQTMILNQIKNANPTVLFATKSEC